MKCIYLPAVRIEVAGVVTVGRHSIKLKGCLARMPDVCWLAFSRPRCLHSPHTMFSQRTLPKSTY